MVKTNETELKRVEQYIESHKDDELVNLFESARASRVLAAKNLEDLRGRVADAERSVERCIGAEQFMLEQIILLWREQQPRPVHAPS